jgi:hypothetical protein
MYLLEGNILNRIQHYLQPWIKHHVVDTRTVQDLKSKQIFELGMKDIDSLEQGGLGPIYKDEERFRHDERSLVLLNPDHRLLGPGSELISYKLKRPDFDFITARADKYQDLIPAREYKVMKDSETWTEPLLPLFMQQFIPRHIQNKPCFLIHGTYKLIYFGMAHASKDCNQQIKELIQKKSSDGMATVVVEVLLATPPKSYFKRIVTVRYDNDQGNSALTLLTAAEAAVAPVTIDDVIRKFPSWCKPNVQAIPETIPTLDDKDLPTGIVFRDEQADGQETVNDDEDMVD